MLLRLAFQLFFQITFACFAVLSWEYWRLRYDWQDLSCAYYRAVSNGRIWLPSFCFAVQTILFLFMFNPDEFPAVSFVFLELLSLVSMLPIWVTMQLRCSKRLQVASVRYVERKYGASFTSMMLILDEGSIDAFPITTLEANWGLSGDQMRADVVDDECIRKHCNDEIDRVCQLITQRKQCQAALKNYYQEGIINGDRKNLRLTKLAWRVADEASALKKSE